MQNYVTGQEYSKIKDVHERTVYRWIEKNDINAKKFNGKWHVQLDDNRQSNFDTDALVANLMSEKRQLQKDNEYLKEQLSADIIT
jgi:hypothetical protein